MGIGFRQQPTANENPQRGGPSMSHYEAPFYSLSLASISCAHRAVCGCVCQESQAANGALSTNTSRSTRPFSLPSYPHAPTHNTSDQSPTDPDSLNRPNSQIMKKGEETGAGKQWRKINFCCRWSLFDKYKFTKKKKKKNARIDRYENSGKAFKIADTIESGPHDRRKCIHRDRKRMEPQSRNVALAAA